MSMEFCLEARVSKITSQAAGLAAYGYMGTSDQAGNLNTMYWISGASDMGDIHV